MEVIHAAIRVSDLDRALSFFRDALGLSVTEEFEYGGTCNVFVGDGDGAEIQLQYDPDDDAPVEPSGVDHLAVGVDDVDAEFDRIRAETGCPVHVEPTDVPEAGARVAFVEGPDGYVVELVQYTS